METRGPFRLFVSYAHEDWEFANTLHKHLQSLERREIAVVWWDRQILPGMDWKQEIDKNLEQSDAILLLLSKNFISSDYCMGKELERAQQRARDGSAQLVPIVVQRCLWEEVRDLDRRQAMPLWDGELVPVNQWSDPDEAWTTIVKGIRSLAQQRAERSQPPMRGATSVPTQLDRQDSNVLAPALRQAGRSSTLRSSVQDPVARSAGVETAQSSARSTASAETSRPVTPAETCIQLHAPAEQRAQPQYRESLLQVAAILANWNRAAARAVREHFEVLAPDPQSARCWQDFVEDRAPATEVLPLVETIAARAEELDAPPTVRADLHALASRILSDDPASARRHLAIARNLDPDSHLVITAEATFYRKRVDLPKACELAQRATRERRDLALGYFEYGLWAEADSRWGDADKHFRTGLSLLDEDRWRSWLPRSPMAPVSGRFLLLAASRLENDVAACQSVLDWAIEVGFKGPLDGQALEAAAYDLRARMLSRANADRTLVAAAHLRAADCYAKTEQFSEEADALRRAVELDPDNVEAKWQLARALSWEPSSPSANERATVGEACAMWDAAYAPDCAIGSLVDRLHDADAAQ